MCASEIEYVCKREKENEEPPLSQDKIKQLEQFDLFHNKPTQSEQPQRFTLRKKQA